MRVSPKLRPFLAPAGLLVIVALAYGVLAPRLGFYLDDWYIVWINKMFGASRFIDFFRSDRPLFAYVYMIFVPIFKDSMLGWQLFAVFTRWVAVCTFWYLLRMLLPKQKMLCLAAAILFAVYPGFQFHWFSVMYSQVYFLMAIYFMSFILMILAVRNKQYRILLLSAALVMEFIGIAPMEYFYGLELLRPIALYIAIGGISPSTGHRLRRTFIYWIPFLLVFVGFTAYRLAFGGAYFYQANLLVNLKNDPLAAIIGLFNNIYHGLYDAVLQVWFDLPKVFDNYLLSSSSLLMIVLIGLGFLITYLLLKHESDSQVEPTNVKIGGILVWIGLGLTLVAMIPFVVAGFKISLEFPENRYLLSLAPGIALFLAGMIDLLSRTNKIKHILLSLLVGLSVGSQFHVAKSFMGYWNQQKDFFDQLSWRIPAMKENTILITEDLNFSQYFSGSSLTAPLNLTYAPESHLSQIPYLMFLSSGGQAPAIPAYEVDQPVRYSYRSLEFQGSTSSMIAFYKPTNDCLQVFSNLDTADEFLFSNSHARWVSIIALSNLDRIIVSPQEPAVPPKEYFGTPDTNQWCYYFEKADLAKQTANWQEVIALYQQAEARGFRPGPVSEWVPMIEALFATGQKDKAMELTRSLPLVDEPAKSIICNVYQRLIDKNDPLTKDDLVDAAQETGCNFDH